MIARGVGRSRRLDKEWRIDYVLWIAGLLVFTAVGGALLRPWYMKHAAGREKLDGGGSGPCGPSFPPGAGGV
jgi:hypothetical protein